MHINILYRENDNGNQNNSCFLLSTYDYMPGAVLSHTQPSSDLSSEKGFLVQIYYPNLMDVEREMLIGEVKKLVQRQSTHLCDWEAVFFPQDTLAPH